VPTGTPDVPLDSRGKPLAGVALEGHLRRQAELDAATEAREDVRAMARMLCRLAARQLNMPSPDALAALAARDGADGQADALRALRCAGVNPEPQRQRWAEQAPVQRQASSRTGDLWADSPDHDPRVTQAIMAGQSGAAVQDIIRQVTEERRAAKEGAAETARSGVLWTTRDGEEVRESPSRATPLMPQRSVVRRDVAPLGEERV
jgi:hypothetical protein